jgi:glycosyltransferase involved in cell wall biosynthesis
MKILYITNKISPAGGLERVLAIKTSALADVFGHEVHILTLNQRDERVFHDFSSKITMHDLVLPPGPFGYGLGYIMGIQKLVSTLKPDLIDVCDDGLKAFFLPLILGRKNPIVYERHVSKVIEYNSLNTSFLKKAIIQVKFALMDFLARYFTRFVVLTNGNVGEWDLPNLVVMPNPLTFFPERVSNLQSKKAIAVGRHAFQKGFDLLLKSWKPVVEKHPDWHLDIYGKEDQEVGLKKLAENLKISDHVSFFEPVKAIEEKYLESSFYILSSRFEGFGMVLTEAMACGVPCVSFDCPCGPADIIQNGADGLLVPDGNVEELTKNIIYMIENEESRKAMGKLARQNVGRFSKDGIVNQWDVLFRSLTKSDD